MTGGPTSAGGATYITKICFDHISEIIKASDLIFGTVTPFSMEN